MKVIPIKTPNKDMTITIVGLGVIGGSFAMSLQEAGYHNIYGIDIDQNTLDKAKAQRIIKEGYTDGKTILPTSDLVIFSLYPRLVHDFIVNHRTFFKDGSILTDATGVKKFFIADIMEVLPNSIDFIFGHPMAGREKRGIDFASSSVYKGANYILTPIPSNKKENLDFMESLIMEMGFGRITRISADYHDELIAFTSQLPHAIAVSLVNSDVEGRETGKFTGDSYRELTRIANINEDLWSELFLENKEPLLKSIQQFEDQLDLIKNAIKTDDSAALKELFIKSTKRREQLDK
ncbi:prephenate dehydrogenase [Trichococcus palustris]|uniref:Prephenate dehydrogenase n=1 Tax=Trichococcus palustris TaxID=140314 RepID=A0A143Y6N9_9LACT|nr:prephenate dehydrogenase [Trichococcus palustris]SFK63351.1 prephenate dehydrogenase [Trichococcus palustris]